MGSVNNKQEDRVSRRRYLAVAGAAGVTALSGCSGGGSTTESGGDTPTTATGGDTPTTTESEESTPTTQSEGGKLTVVQAGSPPDWDPVKGLGGNSSIIGERFFSTLYTLDQGTTLVPDDMVTGMPEVANDGTRYTVEIVDNARFHNGDPVTATDVIYSFRAPLDEETQMASEIDMIDTMTVVDETTVQFDLKFPYGAFPSAIANIYIVPEAVREADKERFNLENPVGSGPFQFVDWQENEFTRLERWDDYWGEKTPNLAEVEFVPVVEPTTRVTQYKTDDVGLLQNVPPKLYSTVQEIEGGSVQETPALNYAYVTFNHNEGETTKPKVREAIDYCVDMDQVVERFVQPVGVRQYQPIPIPIAESWDMPIDEWKQMAVGKDTDRASQLFEEAGVPDNWSCKLLSPPNDPQENMLVSIANGIKEAGYDASVTRLEWGTFLETFTSGDPADYNMYALSWSVTPNPGSQIYDMYLRDFAGTNQGHYWNDTAVMDKIRTARRTTSRDERARLYNEIQTEVIRQRVQIPAWNLKAVWGVKDYVRDFQIHPAESLNPRLVSGYNNVSVEQ